MHFLITAGGTREYIDPIRFISNASSGRMGYALALSAIKAGHKVTLVSASDLQPPLGVNFVGVDSATEMFEAVKKHFGRCDCLIMAAAVADYTIARPAKSKIKRTNRSLSIKLKPTTDILKWAGRHKKKGQIVVGFALEDKAIRRRAGKKLKDKNLDMIIANTPAAISDEKTTIHIKTTKTGWTKMENITKMAAARKIIGLLVR
ncbi:MAG: phosphopantothenoylcysteine decarboxylase [Planctomycetota bacterium]|nr:MAG: phosphopantothenoylcysteine decarboxylase [Planctomycetota bacterium]